MEGDCMAPQPLSSLELSADLLSQWHEQGYLIIEDALPPDKVSALLQVVERPRLRLQQSPHRRKVFGLDVRPLVTEDDAFLELMEWPTTFPLAVQLLQHYNIQLMTSHLIMVPPNPDERNVSWHRDGGTPNLLIDDIPPLMSL